MDKYIKPIINISEFEAEELIMVSNMSIDDLNTDTGWVKYCSISSLTVNQHLIKKLSIPYEIYFDIAVIFNHCNATFCNSPRLYRGYFTTKTDSG